MRWQLCCGEKLVLCSNEVFNLSDTEREESGKIMISLSDFKRANGKGYKRHCTSYVNWINTGKIGEQKLIGKKLWISNLTHKRLNCKNGTCISYILCDC